jgi:exosortase N
MDADRLLYSACRLSHCENENGQVNMSSLLLQLHNRTGIRINEKLILIIALVLTGAVAAFPLNYVASTNFIIGLLLFPFAFFIQGETRINYLYGGLFVAFGILSFYYQLKIFYFFTLAFYILFTVEFLIGELNTVVLFLLVVMSPVFHHVVAILGFPIRIHLSQWAGSILQAIGRNVEVEGNMMLLDGFSFTVDEACMGLNMLAISMLIGVVVVLYCYRVHQARLTFIHLCFFFLTVFLLNIVANLFRILILVLFKILPENPLHELIGVAGLLMYVMIPLYFLCEQLIRRRGIRSSATVPYHTESNQKKVIAIALGIGVMILGFTIQPNRAEAKMVHANASFKDITPVLMDGGITKFYDGNLLIYVKTIPEFFSGEHTPLICWKGSGYTFKRVRETEVDGQSVYLGTLVKGNETLYSAWWYTNGTSATIDQLEWRSKMMKEGTAFCLVNVTATNETALSEQLQLIFKGNNLQIKTADVP